MIYYEPGAIGFKIRVLRRFFNRLKKEQNEAKYRKEGRYMFNFLDKIPYSLLIFVTAFMLLAPFRPMPHIVEKIIMLKNGTLSRPIDIFDLFYHMAPAILLLLKIYRNYSRP